MNKSYYDDYFNKNIVKLKISNNSFKLLNDKTNYTFNNYDELKRLIDLHFINNVYNNITLYKKINRDSYTKLGVISDNRGSVDIMILCDKEYVNMVKYFLEYNGFNYIRCRSLKK